MVTARVILKGSKSYVVNGVRWLKDVPKMVKGEGEISLFESNGYFKVIPLGHVEKPKKKKRVRAASSGNAKKKKKKKKKVLMSK